MAFYPARDAIQKSLGFETNDKQPTTLQHYSVSTVLFAILLAFGVTVRSLGKVYSLVGGVASSYLAYIMPALAYIGAFHPNWLPWNFFKKPHVDPDELQVLLRADTKDDSALPQPEWWLDILSVILVVFGLVVMAFTIIQNAHGM